MSNKRYLAAPLLILCACSTPAAGDAAVSDAVDSANSMADRVVSVPDATTMLDAASEVDADVRPDALVPDASGSADSASPMCPPPGAMTANSTTPGAITTPNPTLRNIAVEWAITGDADNDGVVSVRFRRRADAAWRDAMPLRRIPAGSTAGRSWANRHSGSIFDVEPDTEYEIELFLQDPDGGCAVRTTTVRTRPVPVIPAGANVRAVTPATFMAALGNANPGDVLDMGPGMYPAFTIARDGTPERPITLRGATGAIVMGNIDLFSRHDVRIEGLTIRGRLRFNNGRNITVVRNTVEATSDGIVSLLRSEDCYIADNIVRGASRWEVAALGVSGSNVGEGILVIGPGHVIEHNRVSGFRDALSFMEDSTPDDQWSIDVIENDVDNAGDDGVEADFCAHNCRVVRNRFNNVFIAMSSQPGLGGPTYFVRNVAYNVILSAFKLQRTSYGDVLLHNTIVKNGDGFGIYTSEPVHRAYARNNLFVGGPGGMFNSYSSGSGRVMDIATADPSCDFDYDGYGSTNGMFAGRYGALRFNSLAELRGMSTERHAVSVDLTVFAATVAYPSSPFPALPTADLRLRAGGAAVDVGARIANINDGFAGGAPDLGAYEQSSPLPAYGPR